MDWQDLPTKKNCFTVRNAVMKDLDKRKIVRYFSANTKIVVTQKCVTEKGTYYRTEAAKDHGLNWAFEASAFGLPDEIAPSVLSSKSNSLDSISNHTITKSVRRTKKPTKKQKVIQKAAIPKDGEEQQREGWLSRIFHRRKK